VPLRWGILLSASSLLILTFRVVKARESDMMVVKLWSEAESRSDSGDPLEDLKVTGEEVTSLQALETLQVYRPA
jgi:hypothetical protein